MIKKPTYEELERRIQQLQKAESELRRKEEILQESEKKYQNLSGLLRLLCDNVPDMIWAKDLEKKYIFANRAICKNLLNADTEETIGKTDIFFAERERKCFPDNPEWHTFGKICRDTDQITMDARIPRQFDEYGNVQGKFLFLDVHKAPFIDENGEMIGTVGSGRDITERKRAEEQLQKSEERFRNLYDDAPVGYFEYDLRGNITRVNHTELKMLGYTAEEMIGQPCWKFIVDEVAREQILAKISGVRPPAVGLERTYRRKDGTLFPVLFEDRLLVDEDGHITGIRTAIQDITDRKKMKRHCKKAKRDTEFFLRQSQTLFTYTMYMAN